MNLNKLLSFLHTLERLKGITRHSWTSDGRHESVAEHCWRLACMILLMKGEFRGYDIDRMVTMALFHDIGEIKHGDVPGFDKTGADVERESAALADLAREYADLNKDQIFESVAEFDRQETKEARLVRALDMLEAVIQHNEADLETWIDREYEMNLTYGTDECKIEKTLTLLRDIVRANTKDKIARGNIQR
ncbi:MAG: HD domain-containing protein [Chitinivibrionales bacterium]